MDVNVHPVSDETLMAYLDGELPAARSLEIAAHLERCSACQALAAEFCGLSRRLHEWSVEPAPEGLFQKLVPEPLPESSGFGTRLAGFLRRPAFASVVGVLLLLIVLISRSPSPTSLKVQRVTDKYQLPTGTIGKYEYGGALSRNNQANDQELPPAAGPKIVRSAQLNFIPSNFGTVRTDIERVLRAYKGYIAQLNINTPTGQARWLQATLQVPAGQLDAALGDLRKLGRVTNESQRAEEVTSRYIDMDVRLANARNTEQRLLEILRERTGKLSDVLAAEEQIGRVRQQIEVTEAEQKNLANQIALASIQIRANEDYLQPLRAEDGALTRLRNASVQGIRNAVSGVLAVVLWLLSMGPSLLLITAILFFPVRWAWRRSRRHTLG